MTNKKLSTTKEEVAFRELIETLSEVS